MLLTTPARIVSGGLAVCELPALPASVAPPGTRISAFVKLVLNGGSHSLDVAASLLLAAPDAPGLPLQLEGPAYRATGYTMGFESGAAAAAAGDLAAGAAGGGAGAVVVLPPVAVIGNEAGGTAVVLTSPVRNPSTPTLTH